MLFLAVWLCVPQVLCYDLIGMLEFTLNSRHLPMICL